MEQSVSAYNCPTDAINIWKKEQPESGPNPNARQYQHSSYRGVTGLGVNGGYFDNDQWVTVGNLPASYRGLLHTERPLTAQIKHGRHWRIKVPDNSGSMRSR